MDAISLKKLCLSYGEKMIVKDIDISIKEGDMVSIIGPNGSGKSTILKSIAKLLCPCCGNLYLKKECILEMTNKEVARKLAILLQHNTSPSDICVKDLIYYGRLPHKKWYKSKNAEDEKIVNWAIENTRLEGFKDKTISSLSGGERQRVWLAVALAQEPEVLLLDEPTTYLDIGYQLELLDLVKELNEKLGMTIIMVLHDLNQAAKYSDQLIVLNNGEIVDVGDPKKIITKDLLKKVYSVDSTIHYDDLEGFPIIIPRKRV